ncbi:MAG: hypothetical protein GX087_05305 [Desulfobulbaceae bacterium]|nr:hypothetical protein [Desulfobulbaceae bacterium]
MRKKLPLVFFSLLALVLAPSFAAAAYYKVIRDTTPLREAANASSRVVDTAAKGWLLHSAEKPEKEAEWLEIYEINNRDGFWYVYRAYDPPVEQVFVHKDAVQLLPIDEQHESPPEYVPEDSTDTVATAANNAAGQQAQQAQQAKAGNSRFGFDSMLIGGFISGVWVSAEDLQNKPAYHSQRIWGGHPCKLYSFRGLAGTGIIGALHNEHPEEAAARGLHPDDDTFDVHLENGEILADGSVQLAIDCAWNAAPRQATLLATNNATYQSIVEKFLAKNGLPQAKANIMQLIRVDLEGDGVDEILIVAQNLLSGQAGRARWQPDTHLAAGTGLPGSSKKGDYSLLLLRKIVNGQVQDIPLASFIALQDGSADGPNWLPPIFHKIYQFADLNGDGVLEIITGQDYYEGRSYQVYEVKGGNATLVLENGFGG